jgi:transposase
MFTEKEIEALSSNPFVKSVSAKGITYTDELKRIFIIQSEKGVSPRAIFEEHGFDFDTIGNERIKSAAKRWRKAYKEQGVIGLRDTRNERSGRPSNKEHTLEEKYAQLAAENNLLKAENELLKKIDFAERRLKKRK